MKLFPLFFLVFSMSCSPKTSELIVKPKPVNATVQGDILVGPSILNDENAFVWGGSVVKGKDGKYHMLYSKWDSGEGTENFGNSWVLTSTIAYAVSDYPDREFKFQKVILKAREGSDSILWDGNAAHNPHIKQFNNKYYLYYIGNTAPTKDAVIKGELNRRNQLQQNQNIGVIAFDSFDDLMTGNFERPKQPILTPRTRVKPNNVLSPSPEGTVELPDNLIVVNPAVVYRPNDGKYLLYFKGNSYDPSWKGVHGVAIGNSPTGPFKPMNDIVFHFKLDDGKIASAEDPYVWYHKKHKLFYAVMKDFSGAITNNKAGLAILASKDGINFYKPENPFFMKKEITLKNGDVVKVDRLERPQFLVDKNGIPLVMYAACSIITVNQRNDGTSFNIQIPLQVN